jgi:hypothetical protein
VKAITSSRMAKTTRVISSFTVMPAVPPDQLMKTFVFSSRVNYKKSGVASISGQMLEVIQVFEFSNFKKVFEICRKQAGTHR